MLFLRQDNRQHLVSLAVVVIYISLGISVWKHLLPNNELRWTAKGHETRCMGYQAERLNLKTAVDADDDTPVSIGPGQLSGPVSLGLFISADPFEPACQSAVPVNSPLTQSPILNL